MRDIIEIWLWRHGEEKEGKHMCKGVVRWICMCMQMENEWGGDRTHRENGKKDRGGRGRGDRGLTDGLSKAPKSSEKAREGELLFS